jgi:hypothetical protein
MEQKVVGKVQEKGCFTLVVKNQKKAVGQFSGTLTAVMSPKRIFIMIARNIIRIKRSITNSFYK